MPNYYSPLVPDGIYHILSHAVGTERMFLGNNNYEFFLSKYKQYVLPVDDTFAFCLLPNHFHFLIQIKPYIQVEDYLRHKKRIKSVDVSKASDLIMDCFSNLLNSYTKSFNKVYRRRGGLFIDYLRRVEMVDNSQFGSTIFYIHKNPVHHGYCEKIDSWRWSSYKALIGSSETSLKRKEVLDWFGGVSHFKSFHQQPIDLKKAIFLE